MMESLWGMAAAKGVRIRTGCAVTSIDGGRIDVRTPNGQRTVVAERIVIATNAWPIVVDGVPREEYVPARGQILVTSPVDDLRLHGSYHMDEGYVYFRSLGDRVLLGGARNLDVIGEQTFSMETTSTIQDRLEQLLDTVILPGLDYTIEHRWAGIMGFSHDKRPHIERYSPHVIRAFGCNGMGVAIGSTIARQAAAMVL
jgi:glycine/D-amino acid oxidase-like deaminating enzyme